MSGSPTPKVAYIGASNDDSPQAHAIFVAAMEQVATARVRMEPLEPVGRAIEEFVFTQAGCGVPCCSRTWRPVRWNETDPLPAVQPLVYAAAGEAGKLQADATG